MTTRAVQRDGGTPEWAPEWTQGNLPAAPAAVPASLAVRRGLSFVDASTLALIAIVVVLVSLPRLRRFALRENESDAIATLRILADAALADGGSLSEGDLSPLLASVASRRTRLEDVETQGDGRLRRHGYLFAAVPALPGEGSRGRCVLLAWPWDHGRTGLGAFALEPGGEALGLANADGRFSGPDDPPPAPSVSPDEGWRSVPR